MNKKCLWCVHVHILDKPEYEDKPLECRKYAPRQISGVGTGSSDQNFPYVAADDWCGEFELYTEKYWKCANCNTITSVVSSYCSKKCEDEAIPF